MSRPALDEYLLSLAGVVATRSTCCRLSVGAVLARDGRILSTGYNGAPAGLAHCTHELDRPCPDTVHAEANALVFAARHGVMVAGGTLYATHSPCLACSGLLLNGGVTRVVYRDDYRSRAGIDRLAEGGVTVEQLTI